MLRPAREFIPDFQAFASSDAFRAKPVRLTSLRFSRSLVIVRPGTHLRTGGHRPWDRAHGTRASVAGVVVEYGVAVEG